MCAERNTSGALALLLSLDAKIVNNFQKNIQYLTNIITLLHILAIELQSRDIVTEIYNP